MHIQPVSSLRGEIHLPGDKSISHRYAILGAMANGTTRISHFSDSQDCQATLHCLRALGLRIRQSGNEIEIRSEGWKKFQQPRELLNAGNSGTTIRLLSALLSAAPFVSTIQGDDSLNHRPMKRIMTPLMQMGAEIGATNDEFPPLRITGSQLRGIHYRLPVPSAQVKSCILLAGLMAQGETTVVEETPSRDHTERALPFFDVVLTGANRRLKVRGPAFLRAAQMQIPGDFSSAVYFIIAALIVPGAEIWLRRVGVNPSRAGLLTLLENAGARVEKTNLREFNSEPVCDLKVCFSHEPLSRFPLEISGEQLPNMIDEIPALAVLATRLERGLSVRGAEELRKKESDRIHSIVVNLRNLGVRVEEFPDGFCVPPGQQLQGGRVQTFGDHRIAMAFAVAGLIATEPVELDHPSCVSVSFPEFFKVLQSLSSRT
ncbi:MAG: 3-phosphoshikimate 1-carboxyvinyltransferase [Acidobacteria bacterium]|nr:3-phosphoshikimate 1-carboxyvinyltransferase [Acidobacteriota bacterium]MCZ6768913.1 3-phosphoshikimate 1-carboxyvinyltransferase [Acidobacteriota bacterium]